MPESITAIVGAFAPVTGALGPLQFAETPDSYGQSWLDV